MRSTGEQGSGEQGSGEPGSGERPGDDGSSGDGRADGGLADHGLADHGQPGGFGVPVFASPAQAVAAVEALRVLAGVDVRGLDDESCLGLFDSVEVLDRLLHSVRFELLAELDARSLTDRRFGHTVANQAGWRHGTDPRRTKRDLATGNVLRRSLPTVAAALAAGTVSSDRARVIAAGINERNRDALTAMQPELLAIAEQSGTFREFSRDIEQVTRLADTDGVEPAPPRDHATLGRVGDHVTATIDLYGSAAIGFAERLNTEADRLYKAWAADRDRCAEIEVPPRSELLAQAFMNLIEAGAAHRHVGRTEPAATINIVVDVDEQSIPDLFHDGVLLPGPATGSTVDWSKRAFDLTGTRLRHSNKEWELLTCDPTYTWILIAADGHPVACRSDERHANRHQRRALAIRDGGCVFPGCDAPVEWCDAHHVIHHQHDGPTDTRNLAMLCRRHHGVIHRRGWTMTANAADESSTGEGGRTDGLYVITSPTGIVLTTRHTRRPSPTRRPEPA